MTNTKATNSTVCLKLLSILLIWICSSVVGFTQTAQEQIYRCYITGDMAKWKTVMNNFANQQSSNAEKTELISYYYGYIGYQLGVKNKSEAQIYIDKGDIIIDEQLKNKPTADMYAYKAAFVGFKIGVSPLKAPFIGKSSVTNVQKALNADPENIQANIEQANVLYYSPSAFGGDKDKAKEYYNKAVKLFENKPELLKQNWLYLSLLTNIAQIYSDEKKYTEAKQLYEKILKIEPNYNYVKNELYPALVKKL